MIIPELTSTDAESISAWSALVQAIVVVVAAVYALIQLREARNSRRASIALHLIESLNIDDAIKRRHKLYKSIAKRIPNTRPKDDLILGRISNEFSSIGFLLKHKLIDGPLVITLYFAATIRCWELMAPWVEKQRFARSDAYYAEGFEYLYHATLDYQRLYRPEPQVS
jgi:hypothetical protein